MPFLLVKAVALLSCYWADCRELSFAHLWVRSGEQEVSWMGLVTLQKEQIVEMMTLLQPLEVA